VTFSRMFIAALAVAALLAPTAAAKPIDTTPDMRASVAEALAKEREARQQEQPGPRTWSAYPTPEARQPRLPGPPTWPVNPQPITQPSVAAADDGDGIDWATIGIGVGLTFVALGAITAITYRIRVKQRPRIAA
jgi:hypothetical protein